MRMIDFEYNGQRLSDFGMIPCLIDSSSDTAVEVANNVVINKIRAPNTYKYLAAGYSYEDVLTVNFQTCKSGCDMMHTSITDVEINRMMRWLNRKRYCKFKPIYIDGYFGDVYYEGTFNVKPIVIGKNIVGLDLTFSTNAPYGFLEPINFEHEFTSPEDKLILSDISDEVGHIYCNATITCLENGDLNISNSLDPDNVLIIHDCSNGEIITLNGQQKIISTNLDTHKTLCNDFNYNFLRINNTYEDVENVFTSALKCKVSLEYSPIRKVGLIV